LAAKDAGEESKTTDEAMVIADIDKKCKEEQIVMWDTLMQICNTSVLGDVASGKNASGSRQLLAELIRIDLKGKADAR